jgi:3-hydroxyacyl-[acyl-carrier-protein] dehydratase
MTTLSAPAPQTGRTARTMGFTEIKNWLRHRHPMLYLDRILDYEPGDFLISRLSVSGAQDAVAGHFPERAIYPASHLTQAWAQSGIILYQLSTAKLADDEITLVGSVHSRFTKIVVPGDQVTFAVRAERIIGNAFFFGATATVEGTVVAKFRGNLVRVQATDLGDPLW